jgi:hypothetical protein
VPKVYNERKTNFRILTSFLYSREEEISGKISAINGDHAEDIGVDGGTLLRSDYRGIRFENVGRIELFLG